MIPNSPESHTFWWLSFVYRDRAIHSVSLCNIEIIHYQVFFTTSVQDLFRFSNLLILSRKFKQCHTINLQHLQYPSCQMDRIDMSSVFLVG